MNTMIDVNKVSFSYGRKKSKVLDGFSMQLAEGSVYGLLGKNGTGKSTLLYLMAGLLRSQKGNVLYKGVDVKKRYPDTLQDMFLVPEEFALPNVSLKQYVKLNAPFYPKFSKEDMVKYLKKHNCYISTSLDGPKEIHDVNRPLQDKTLDHHEIFERNLGMIRSIWQDKECASALMTTSKYSLGNFKSIIDEYVRLGFNNIFLRSLNPYGFAKEHKDKIAYPIEDFIENFKEGLDYIIQLNKNGIFFKEGYSALLLKRMLTPFATGFVDLQSPSGVGIAGAIYDYDGSVYVADEGRMMARFKNYAFRLGNVNENTHQEMFNGEKMHMILNDACTECLPGCADCVFQPYCGADPVRNLSEQGDMIGHRPTNEMCKKNKAIFYYLFELLKKNDPEINRIFWSWIR